MSYQLKRIVHFHKTNYHLKTNVQGTLFHKVNIMYRSLFILISFLISAAQPVSAVAPITTQGNQVLIGGQEGSLAGNSFFWSNFSPVGSNDGRANGYYNADVVSWLKQDWNTSIVRAAMGVEEFNGYLSNSRINENAVRAVVDAAIANDIYVIIDWHTHHAEDYEQDAIDFFSEMAEEYGNNDNVIFEIYNEPIGDFNSPVTTWNSIRDYAKPVIAAIREHSNNLIIVGTPFFSQRVDIASQNPIQGVENLAYTLHFYAGTHRDGVRQYARDALANGIPLFVTEWGTVNASGDGGVDEAETRLWMDFLEENNISHLNWSINDKEEGSSALRGTELHANNRGNWPLGLLTQSGLLVRDIIRNWSSVDINQPNEPETPTETETQPIPSLIEAEDFDRQSGIDRDGGVETEVTTDVGGGLNVGYIDHNDYIEFDVNVRRAGTYKVDIRLASNTIGGNVDITFNGNNTALFTVGFTGGWQDWVTQTQEVELEAGEQVMRLTFSNVNATEGILNINWVDFTPLNPLVMQPILEFLLNDE